VGARVFFHDSDQTVVYGRVIAIELGSNATQVARVEIEPGNVTVLPVSLLTLAT
ncbi:hypothetical protein FRB99_006905, partial [Tulasnella sp. 403]